MENEKEILTVSALCDMAPGTVIAEGEIIDSPEGLNFDNTGGMLKWVAVRGEIPDWAIYVHFAGKSRYYILRHGEKVHWERDIRKLVPCDDLAMTSYRH